MGMARRTNLKRSGFVPEQMEVLYMPRLKVLLQSLLAIFAVCSVTASAASADVGQKLSSTPVLKGITGENSTSVLTAGSVKITCTEGKNTGKVKNQTELEKVVVTFEGCKVTESKKPCTAAIESPGAGAEKIVTEALKGELVETKEATGVNSHEVGLLLEPEVANKGFVTLEETKSGGVKCTPVTKVTGSIAGEVTPTELFTKIVNVEFGINSLGKQAIKTVERSVSDAVVKPELEAFGATEVTEVSSDAALFEEKVKIETGP
jgi:hypothetical protein